MTIEAQFVVMEAYGGDVYRGVARIGGASMKALNSTTGTYVEVFGGKRTVVRCLPLHPPGHYPAESSPNGCFEPSGTNSIRIDDLTGHNAGVSLGGTVSVKKADLRSEVVGFPSMKVVIRPLEGPARVDPRHLTKALDGMAVVVGDHVSVSAMVGRQLFEIVSLEPRTPWAYISSSAVFRIVEDQT